MKRKYTILLATHLIVAGLAYSIKDSRTELKIETKEVVKVVNRDIIKEITKPDGTKIVIKDRSTENTQEHASKTSLIKPDSRKWLIGLSAPPQGFSPVTLTLHRKVFKNLYMGLYGRTDGEIGIGLTMSF